MTTPRLVLWLATLYVVLLPLGRSGLPLNAQWGDLLFPLLALALWRGGPSVRWISRRDWPLALYLAVTAVTALVSPEPLTGLGQLAKQVYVAAVFLVFRVISRDPQVTAHLQRAFVTVFAVITALSIHVVLWGIPRLVPISSMGAVDALPFLGAVPRLRGPLLTPEMLGSGLLLAFLLALALREASHGRGRVFWSATAALIGAGEFFTFSHSVAGFAVAVALFLAVSIRRAWFRFTVRVGALLAVIAVNAASLIGPGAPRNDHGVGPVAFALPGGRLDAELNHYAALKLVAWAAFLEKPWTGLGPGRFPSATERAFQEGRLTARYRHKPAQCDFAGRLAEAGVAGGMSLLLLWASWLRPGFAGLAAMDPLRRAAFAAVCGLLVNSLNADVMNLRFLWIALAWTAVLPDRQQGQTESFTRP